MTVRNNKLVDEGFSRTALLEDTGLLAAPFPLCRITQCWEEAMGDDPSEYRDEAAVAGFMERNREVKEIFQ